MSSKNEILLIQSQFDVVWKLAQLILPKLITEDHFWEPVLGSWSMRKNQKGWWKVDLEIPEPEPTCQVPDFQEWLSRYFLGGIPNAVWMRKLL